jgi:hypothetical protein
MRRVWADRTESVVEYCENNYEDCEDVDEVVADWESLAFSEFACEIVFDEWYGQTVYVAEG